MANFPQTAKIPSAVKTRNPFDLSFDNITTSDFFKIKPSACIECIPGDSFHVQSESLIRCYSLAVPTFGRVNHYLRWYWVPMRTLMHGWNPFIEQTPTIYPGASNPALISKVPTFNNADIVGLFRDSVISQNPITGYYATVTSSGADDAVLSLGSSNYVHIRFTQAGRALMDMLQNLGYQINFSLSDNRELSALPLLAYLRVFTDYYVNPQYVTVLQQLFNLDSGNIFTQVSHLSEWLHDFLPGFSNYDPDIFVSAWDNPISPNETNFNPSIQISDVTLYQENSTQKSAVYSKPQQSISTPLIRRDDNNSTLPTNLSDYILKSLRAVTNYCIRNNIAGYKFWDRLKAEYGAVLDYKEKGTSLYINTKVTNIKVAEVISTADTQGANLGALGGQALGYDPNAGSFDFDSKEEAGYLIAVSSIVPVIGYYQGIDRHCLHVTPLQFFHGDFESLGVDAIQAQELFASQFNGDTADQMSALGDLTKVFGFAPRYYEYKTKQNTLSGDFRVYSRASAGTVNSYHLMRAIGNEFDFSLDYDWSVQHDQAFARGENEQFDRIFSNTNPDYDHFILIHHHSISAQRNMKQLGETIFDNEDFEHNKKVEVQYNGSQFN